MPFGPTMRRFLSCSLALLSLLSLACGKSHGAMAPAFSLELPSAEVRLLPGLSRQIPVTLRPEPGFTGNVVLSVVDPGSGVTARFDPAALTLAGGASAQATLVLTATETAATGKRTLAIQGDANGMLLTANLVVDIPAAAFFSVVTYRGADQLNFAFLAYQDGDGPWTAVPGQGGLYRLPVTHSGGKFGVLLGDVCEKDGASTWITNGFFSTLGEVQLLQALVFCNPQPGPPPVTFDLTGALAGAAGGSVLISANSGVWSFPAGTAAYALKMIKGNGDLVAAAYPSLQDYIPSRIIVERGRDAQAASTRDFDFGNQGSDPLPRQAIQVPALAADETFQGTVQYLTAKGQVAILGYGKDLSAYAPFPPAAALPGDLYLCSFQAVGADHSRSLQAMDSASPGLLAPRFPTNIPPFQVTASGGLRSRLALAWDAVTPIPSVHEVLITQQVQQRQAYCYLYFGQSWHAGAAQMSWSQPDLSAVPGFDPGFLPQSGSPAQISIYQSGNQTSQPAELPFGPVASTFLANLKPQGRFMLPAESVGVPGMRLKVVVAPTKAAAVGAPRTEYWSVNRRQTQVP
jgi:hypothetical protein